MGPMNSKARSSATSWWRMTLDEEVQAVLQQLTPHEEHILRLRFGIGKGKLEMDDVAASLALTPAAVHRIEWSALRKLWLAAVMEERREWANAG
jgi:DNA-directed RNA polymerase sigma subunit (sigma70/sigma32)